MSYGGRMKLDTMLVPRDLVEAAEQARNAEDMGFDGLWSVEAQHDPFLPLGAAATATRRVSLGTAIAVVFPRSPMILAHTAWDLAAYSGGRFILGLGTQVKGHNERRFSVKWESPGKRLREVILALRAIWDCWQKGRPCADRARALYAGLARGRREPRGDRGDPRTDPAADLVLRLDARLRAGARGPRLGRSRRAPRPSCRARRVGQDARRDHGRDD